MCLLPNISYCRMQCYTEIHTAEIAAGPENEDYLMHLPLNKSPRPEDAGISPSWNVREVQF